AAGDVGALADVDEQQVRGDEQRLEAGEAGVAGGRWHGATRGVGVPGGPAKGGVQGRGGKRWERRWVPAPAFAGGRLFAGMTVDVFMQPAPAVPARYAAANPQPPPRSRGYDRASSRSSRRRGSAGRLRRTPSAPRPSPRASRRS